MALLLDRPNDVESKAPSNFSLKKLNLSTLLGIVVVVLIVVPVIYFLALAFFPRLSTPGAPIFSLTGFKYAFAGDALRGLLDSLGVSIASGAIATSIGLALAWITKRTNVRFKKLISASVWFLLLVPTYLTTAGWQRLLEPGGILVRLHIGSLALFHPFFGPLGVIVVLGFSGIPFAYLTIGATVENLGAELEDAARVHAASRMKSLLIIAPIFMPAILSAFAIVFAESMSDFGVAYSLAAGAHFPMATYSLYTAIDSIPLNFSGAAAISWILILSALVPLIIQRRLTKSKSYAIAGGRRRRASMVKLEGKAKVGVYAFLAAIFFLAILVPLVGILTSSLLSGFGGSISFSSLTISNYTRVFSSTLSGSPLWYSTLLSLMTATITVAVGGYLASVLVRRGSSWGVKALDFVLLGSVALPGIVLGAGYIFSYNQPIFDHLGFAIYGTSKLLLLGYVASAIPGASRLLVGPISQVQSNMAMASRVYGSNPSRAWRHAVLPFVARALLSAWLLTFAKTLFELPMSQLLYPPGLYPLSVAINRLVAGYDYGGGSAMSIVALLYALVIVGVASLIYRLVIPKGWKALLNLEASKNEGF